MANNDNLMFNNNLKKIDKEMNKLINFEEERQSKKIILIASESLCPKPVKEALNSVFTNLYGEGLPSVRMSTFERNRVSEHARHLSFNRRYADRRYYRGVEYINFVEALAQKRIAECFATKNTKADDIFANVQPHSGGPANSIVYEAFLKPGQTIMGMALNNGGHLSHGSELNRSGKYYNIVSYEVNKITEKLDYDEIKKLTIENKPDLITAGYSSYPWDIDWKKFREIADEVGAYLIADVAHTAGLIVGGQLGNPIDYADAVVFTTHKSLCGPRGAVILSTNEENAKKIDDAVFPGEQGGAHFNNIAAKAVCFKIAQTEKFKELQKKIIENTKALADAFEILGLKLAYTGTNTHIVLLDLKGLKQTSGVILKGDIVVRILELCGITANKNTIHGDESAMHPTGVRFGTTIVTQRGMNKKNMEKLAEIIYKVITNIQTFNYIGPNDDLGRGRIDIKIVEEARKDVEELQKDSYRDVDEFEYDYPHYSTPKKGKLKETVLLNDHKTLGAQIEKSENWLMPFTYSSLEEELATIKNGIGIFDNGDMGILEISGDFDRVQPFLQSVTSNNIYDLKIGKSQKSLLFGKDNKIIDEIELLYLESKKEIEKYIMITNPGKTEKIKLWLRYLSDGYFIFDEDIHKKIEGPVIIKDLKKDDDLTLIGLCGKNSQELLNKIDTSIEGLEYNEFLETKIKSIRTIVFRSENKYGILVKKNKTSELWYSLFKDGMKLGIKPIGVQAREKLNVIPIDNNDQNISEKHENLYDLTKPYFIGEIGLRKGMKISSKKKNFTFKESGELKKSCLYNEHKKLTKKIVSFAGWEMPVVYSGIGEEHNAVRKTAGLFDVSHMGTIEIKGNGATRFLDLIATNYVPRLRIGQSQYSTILAPNGHIMDDIFIYRLEKEKYMVVVNASNAEKINAWLQAVNSKEVIIDVNDKEKELDVKPIIRDLKDKRAGDDQIVDVALQGPNSLKILQNLTKDKKLKNQLRFLQKNHYIIAKLKDFKAIVSRTGYTGAELGYELYLHPDNAPTLWNMILEKNKEYGVIPTGLGARDSTRIEAGFPLYGHEIAGPFDLSPIEAGYGYFVKLHKPFFIGREFIKKRALERKYEIVRFKVDSKGQKPLKLSDPVVNRNGQFIGKVTSCALVDGYQVGMALLDRKYIKEGTRIGLFPIPRSGKVPAEKSKAELGRGDRLMIHEEGVVLSRFPEAGIL